MTKNSNLYITNLESQLNSYISLKIENEKNKRNWYLLSPQSFKKRQIKKYKKVN